MALIEHQYRFDDTRLDPSSLLPETLEALEEYNFSYRQHPQGYFFRLDSQIKSYSRREDTVLKGKRKGADLYYVKACESDQSRKEAVVWHNAWAQSVAPRTDAYGILDHIDSETDTGADSNSWDKLILADFMYFTLKHAGVRDGEGDTIPVLSIPSPSLDRRGFTAKSGAKPIGKLAIAAMDLCRLERVSSTHVGGVSLGAAVSAELVSRAGVGIDTRSAFLGELPNADKRTLLRFGLDYMADGKDKKSDYAEDGPLPRSAIVKGGEDSHILRQTAGNGNVIVNFRLVRDMCRGEAAQNFRRFSEKDIPTTLEYGTDSAASAGVPGLQYQPHMCELKDKDLLQLLIARNAPHAHSENIVQTVDAMLRSIKFAGY
jgi:hypothetical protein